MIFISAISVLLQYIAAYLSIRMIRITGKHRAWMLIAAAITLAALRRSYQLSRLIFANIGNPPNPIGELFSFLTSVCMVAGVAYIAPLLLSIKRSEESLRKSETKYRVVSDNTHDWEYWLSPEGSFNYISPSCKRISGYDADEFIADPGLRLRIIHPDDRESYENHRLYVRDKKAPDEIEFRIVRADGALCWIGHVCLPVFDSYGSYIGIRGSNRDITKRKQAEESVLEHKNFTANLIENSASATFVLDKAHRVMIWNKACEELTGCPESDMIGTNNQWKPFYTDRKPTVADIVLDNEMEHLPLLGKSYSRSSLNPRGIRSKGWYQNLGGKDRYIVFEAAPIYNINGELIAAIETLQDITESKRFEEQLMQSQKMEAVGRLAGGIAHDFNNLLTPIIGYSDLVLSELPEKHFARDKIRVVRDTGARAADLVTRLLAFSRKQVLEVKPVNLNEIVWNMNKIFARTIGEDIELELNINRSIKNISADAGQIGQVLMNLVINAADAMPDGGRLIIETADVYLDEKSELMHSQSVIPGQYVMLAVTDTGTGMSHEIMEMIFEPFFTTKEPGKGTGLGLSTTYGIINQHNGYMWAYSEPGKGTAFKVYLPAILEQAKEIKKDVSPVTIKGTETILVVDDESVVRQFVIDVLQPLGYKVLDASCADEALKICGNIQGKIDLLLTDIVMPGMNGQELAALFTEKRQETKVIFMSGYTEEFNSDNGKSNPGELFLRKPLTPEKLTMKLRKVLDMSPERSAMFLKNC